MHEGAFAASFDEVSRTLVVTGDIDESSTPAFRDLLETRTDGFTLPLTVDLSGVEYLPSAAVGVLAGALDQAGLAGQPFELVAAQGTIVQRVLTVVALPHRTS